MVQNSVNRLKMSSVSLNKYVNKIYRDDPSDRYTRIEYIVQNAEVGSSAQEAYDDEI